MREPVTNALDARRKGFRRGQGGIVDSRKHSTGSSGQGRCALEIAAIEMVDGCVDLAH